ncbi:MAG TPA: glycosyltransferase [Candidatus Binataceae bacterium]|nr:glycosyltransferase [Candidatus Binataceae bacterium]
MSIPTPAPADRFARPIQGDGARARVLHYLCTTARGGIEEHVLSLLAHLPARGFRPYLAAPPDLLRQMGPELTAIGARTIAVRRSSPWDFRDAAVLAATLSRERIAIVHSHLFVGSMFASPLARLAGVRAVVETFHLPEVWRMGKRLKRSFWLDRRMSRWVDRYVAVSAAAARHLTDAKGIPAHKVRTIFNGRDLSRFHPAAAAERRQARAALGLGLEPAVLLIGRLEPQKGHALMLEAAVVLKPMLPTVRILFAGTGSLERELRARSDAAGLTGTVNFLGYRPDPEVLLAAADVVVLPSRYEGLPLAAIEAMAAARPVVATDIDGIREVVIDGSSGLLVRPGDVHGLARAVERLVRFPMAARQFAINGRRRAERHFDVRRQVEETISLYQELLSPRRRVGDTTGR